MNIYDIEKLKRTAYYTGARFDDWSYFFKNLNSGFTGTSFIHQLMIEREIKRLSQSYDVVYATDKYDNDHFLQKYKQFCKEILNFFASNILLPELYLVDTLPAPFNEKSWDSMTVDEKDSQELKIREGIYFKKGALMHPYFETIIAHELIHWTISHFSIKHYLFTNLIEEGVCDYLSYFLLLRAGLIDEIPLTNFITFLRVLKTPNTVWSNYYRFSKIIQAIVNEQSLDFLIDVIKKGRESVNSLSIKHNRNQSIYPDAQIVKLNNCFTIAESSIVLCATDYYLLQKLIEEKIFDFRYDVLSDPYLSKTEMKKSIQSLADLSFLGNSGNTFYQSFSHLPFNLKFKIEK